MLVTLMSQMFKMTNTNTNVLLTLTGVTVWSDTVSFKLNVTINQNVCVLGHRKSKYGKRMRNQFTKAISLVWYVFQRILRQIFFRLYATGSACLTVLQSIFLPYIKVLFTHTPARAHTHRIIVSLIHCLSQTGYRTCHKKRSWLQISGVNSNNKQIKNDVKHIYTIETIKYGV